jgi:hypothetical protein
VAAVLRVGLLAFAAIELSLGVWTLAFPESFYNDVPTVALTPPFSEHLMRDFGGATLGLAIVLGAAGIWLERRVAIVALLAYLAFSVPHLVFHLGHLEGASAVETVVLVGVLAASVSIPLLLLVLALRIPRARGQHRTSSIRREKAIR